MSWSTNSLTSRYEYLWTDEGIAQCIAIIKEKDALYYAAIAAKEKSAVLNQILEPIWSVQKKKTKTVKPEPRRFTPATTTKTPTKTATKTANRPCCVGCKKFQIHPNPPPHFTAEDKSHCCAYCRITGGQRHGEHCARQKA